MAFLDRLVSDVIKKSTGYNARSFVRAVGGKNLVLLGGAALAGALAVDKMRQSDKPAAPGAGPPPPPLPPSAGAPPPPPVPTELPPLPTEVPPVPPPQELVYAIVRTMVAAALADGDMHAEEKVLIEKRLGESGLAPEQIQQIHKDLVIPATPDTLSSLVTTAEEKEVLYRFGALVVLADDTVTDQEKAWLNKLAAALDIEDAQKQAIEQEIFSDGSRSLP